MDDLQAKIGQVQQLMFGGKFIDAEKLLEEFNEAKIDMFPVSLFQGLAAVHRNKFAEGEEWLKKAISQNPADPNAKFNLGSLYYRQKKYTDAIPLFRELKIDATADKLEQIIKGNPFKINGPGETTSADFVRLDPLPVIKIQINGKEPINVLIDTGGADLIIDRNYAKDMGILEGATSKGKFAGDKTADVGGGVVDSVTFGDWIIESVPINLLEVRHTCETAFPDLQIDAIIGTCFFYHFIATIDYLGKKLILSKITEENEAKLEKEITNETHVIPFWLVSTHLCLAYGSINGSEERLLFMDTGLAGGGYLTNPEIAKELNISYDESAGAIGRGGGGDTVMYDIELDTLSLGDAVVEKIGGQISPTQKFNYGGIPTGGIISHSFFKNFRTTFDYRKMRVILNRK